MLTAEELERLYTLVCDGDDEQAELTRKLIAERLVSRVDEVGLILTEALVGRIHAMNPTRKTVLGLIVPADVESPMDIWAKA